MQKTDDQTRTRAKKADHRKGRGKLTLRRRPVADLAEKQLEGVAGGHYCPPEPTKEDTCPVTCPQTCPYSCDTCPRDCEPDTEDVPSCNIGC